jgi:hypothetical protein
MIEILSNKGKLIKSNLTHLTRVGETIIDSLLGMVEVKEVLWMTDVDKVRLYVVTKWNQ